VKSSSRRAQIVEVTLQLLADQRVDQVSTRRIALAAGVSQPALFRHFRRRDDILIAAVGECRQRLGAVVEDVLAGDLPPLAQLESLTVQLRSFVAGQPGLARILFHDVASGDHEELRLCLSQLVSMQQQLVSQLLIQAWERGDLSEPVDAPMAALFWVSMVQGTVLQWQMGGRSTSLPGFAVPLVKTWLRGFQEGCPAAAAAVSSLQSTQEVEALSLLDVRPILASGQDPLAQILGCLQRTSSDGLMILHCPFEPRPLLRLLANRGHQAIVRPQSGGLWELWLLGLDSEHPVELVDLPMPEPMERALELAEQLDQGSSLLAHTPRVPQLLLAALRERGFAVSARASADGSGLVHVVRTAR